jgi:hypothetical protein
VEAVDKHAAQAVLAEEPVKALHKVELELVPQQSSKYVDA